MEAKHIAIPGIDAGNRVASHELHLTSDSDARYGRSSDVVVRDQEGIGDGAEHSNLMADVGQIRACGRLDLAKDLEASGHLINVTWIGTECLNTPTQFPAFERPITRRSSPVSISSGVGA
jgi:hypothetical protein